MKLMAAKQGRSEKQNTPGTLRKRKRTVDNSKIPLFSSATADHTKPSMIAMIQPMLHPHRIPVTVLHYFCTTGDNPLRLPCIKHMLADRQLSYMKHVPYEAYILLAPLPDMLTLGTTFEDQRPLWYHVLLCLAMADPKRDALLHAKGAIGDVLKSAILESFFRALHSASAKIGPLHMLGSCPNHPGAGFSVMHNKFHDTCRYMMPRLLCAAPDHRGSKELAMPKLFEALGFKPGMAASDINAEWIDRLLHAAGIAYNGSWGKAAASMPSGLAQPPANIHDVVAGMMGETAQAAIPDKSVPATLTRPMPACIPSAAPFFAEVVPWIGNHFDTRHLSPDNTHPYDKLYLAVNEGGLSPPQPEACAGPDDGSDWE